jgi:hypothetical protein
VPSTSSRRARSYEEALYFDHIYDSYGERERRILVLSAGTFDASHEATALRLVTLEGLPAAPQVRIQRYPLVRSGIGGDLLPPVIRRLWPQEERLLGAPTVIQGTDIDEVYARACSAAGDEAHRSMLIVHLDLSEEEVGEGLPFPASYPLGDEVDTAERQRWLDDLVSWWQLPRSQLEHRIPYVHGTRLRRYAGAVDQVDRIINLLRTSSTTRALAVLVDPLRDFKPNGEHEEFASFCLVEFRRREVLTGGIAVDCIAFYRAQEFERWWPVNVAELRYLQRAVADALQFRAGRITTIAAEARTTISRTPTQVAIPIIDRWLDQAPHMLHVLASTLVNKPASMSPLHQDAVRQWRRSLDDQREAASSFNPDGIPVAIEGLEHLALYLKSSANSNYPNLGKFIQSLQALALLNRDWEESRCDHRKFMTWSPNALRWITELQRLTKLLLSSDELPSTEV